jgi:hypothetical protein
MNCTSQDSYGAHNCGNKMRGKGIERQSSYQYSKDLRIWDGCHELVEVKTTSIVTRTNLM